MEKNIDEKRVVDNGKYALIEYLVEHKKLTLQDIINLKPQEGLALIPRDNLELMQELKQYVEKSQKSIKAKGWLFPGRLKDGKSSEASISQSLRYYLRSKGRDLADIGLTLYQDSYILKKKKKKEPKTSEEILDYVKNLLE